MGDRILAVPPARARCRGGLTMAAGEGRGVAGTGPAACAAQPPPAACVLPGGAAGTLRGRCPASSAAAAPAGPSPCWGGGGEIANEISVNYSLLQV